MWFIIIFGSLPTVRGVIFAVGNTVKARATGRSNVSDPSSGKLTAHHNKGESWIELSGGAQHCQVTSSKLRRLGKTDSEEEIWPTGVMGNEIMVIREMTVQSERGCGVVNEDL